jgi:phage-related tail protein
MADPLSVTAGLVGLVGFAFQASKSLYQVIESFKSSKRAVRELREEVESLNSVLATLSQIAIEYDAQLTSLKLPLCDVVKHVQNSKVLSANARDIQMVRGQAFETGRNCSIEEVILET